MLRFDFLFPFVMMRTDLNLQLYWFCVIFFVKLLLNFGFSQVPQSSHHWIIMVASLLDLNTHRQLNARFKIHTWNEVTANEPFSIASLLSASNPTNDIEISLSIVKNHWNGSSFIFFFSTLAIAVKAMHWLCLGTCFNSRPVLHRHWSKEVHLIKPVFSPQ